MGLLPNGLSNEDPKDTIYYPRSRAGVAQEKARTVRFIQCTQFAEIPGSTPMLARRVLRALLPTWGVHMLVSRETADMVGVDTPLGDLQNTQVLEVHEAKCTERFPCGFLDSQCMNKITACSCRCFRANCRMFVDDFAASFKTATRIPECKPFLDGRQ